MEAAMGARLLGEVEEMSLEEVLDHLQVSANGSNTKTPLKITHMPDLDEVAARHFRSTQAPALAISGRHLPLILKFASMLVSAPHHYTLLVIDLEGRFDATRLTCVDSDARHIYVHRPARPSNYANSSSPTDHVETTTNNADHLRALVTEASNFMLYGSGATASASRRWWGTVVLGGLGAGDIVAGWKGWLRVNREHVPGFNLGVSAEEALARRAARHEVVQDAGWTADSQWGGFNFKEG